MNTQNQVSKLLIWLVFLLLVSSTLFIALRAAGFISLSLRQTLTSTESQAFDPTGFSPINVLDWRFDGELAKPVDSYTRQAVTQDYLNALDELRFALQSKETYGLATYFHSTALEDVLNLVEQDDEQNRTVYWENWRHSVKMEFYAPDGETISFEDDHYYAYMRRSDTEDATPMYTYGKRKIQVLMNQDNGTWRIYNWRVLENDIVFDQHRNAPQYQLQPTIAVADIRGTNYIAQDAPFNDLWPKFNALEVAEDFKRIKALGFNTVRFFIPFPMPLGIENLETLVSIAENEELFLIPTLFDTYTSYRLEDLGEAENYLERLSKILASPSVLIVDVKNEADRDFDSAGEAEVAFFLRWAMHRTRELFFKPAFVGLISPSESISPFADVVSLHHYGPANELGKRIADGNRYQKPILLEEFGYHSFERSVPDPHSQLEQARYYQDIVHITAEQNVGWLQWTLHDLPKGTVPGNRRVERHLGIVDQEGQLKLAARALLGEYFEAPTLRDDLRKWRFFIFIAAAISLAILAGIILFFVLRRRRKYRERVLNLAFDEGATEPPQNP